MALNPPTQPYNLVPGRKLNKEAICREFVVVETKIHDLEHNVKLLHGENARLRAGVLKFQAEMELRFRETERKFEERFVALKSSAAEEAAVRNSGIVREEESDSSDSCDVEVVNEAERKAKMSVEASNHSKIKARTSIYTTEKLLIDGEQQLVHFMYCKFLGVSKLSEKGDFPIVVDDPDDLPFVDGSEDVRQVHFHWDKPNKFPANHASIMTIVSFTQSHGSNYVSKAAPYLEKIKQGNLEARFITKYQALQKVFRGTTGKKLTKPGGELSRAMRDNRARGVCLPMPCEGKRLTCPIHIRNLKCAKGNGIPYRLIHNGAWRSTTTPLPFNKCLTTKTLMKVENLPEMFIHPEHRQADLPSYVNCLACRSVLALIKD